MLNIFKKTLLLFFVLLYFSSCSKRASKISESPDVPGGAATSVSNDAPGDASVGAADADREAFIEDFWRWSFGDAGLPEELSRKVADSAAQGPDFIMDLLAVLETDSSLYKLVDKTHALSNGYAPSDLVELTGGSYRITRRDLMLRKAAASSLEEMAAAAKADGVTLTVGSSYRSQQYQVEVYNRNVREMGQEAADRESAKPGYSQHQTGLVVDFSPIDDSFADTAAGKWVLAHAGRFGWSISFPDGYEKATGYRWESWHYRYVGKELVYFIDTHFGGIQQYALQFIEAWIASSGE
ncbi:M15 family metallopeptidase [Leadbettera azotonutricia]|uniref:Serine-type D-Ala-D-Ala carboxypeptidase n=1 Tax=Leadbettera azotonutricia (strain ATCC BAA-888 / DSM 13862 / ZAS-9) TaxID=545695 RepID=F5YCQ6_LEAAZ|nr:M15 family metallopeptidase [Leadbettera azotonutricia]AEF83157.1 serine-type D-Ala-D-Ala carboxypeptidase [Leadbettera azotonutricia ZAS-9]